MFNFDCIDNLDLEKNGLSKVIENNIEKSVYSIKKSLSE